MSPVLSRFHDDERDRQEKKTQNQDKLVSWQHERLNRQFSEGLPLLKKTSICTQTLTLDYFIYK